MTDVDGKRDGWIGATGGEGIAAIAGEGAEEAVPAGAAERGGGDSGGQGVFYFYSTGGWSSACVVCSERIGGTCFSVGEGGVGDAQRKVGSSTGRHLAGGEFKRAYACGPVEASRGREVLVGVPEGAVVGWVNAGAAVVAPAGETAGLGSAALIEDRFCFKGAEWVAGHAAGEANRGIDGAAGDAEAEAEIVRCVCGHAAHPTAIRIGCVGALLVDRRAGCGGCAAHTSGRLLRCSKLRRNG